MKMREATLSDRQVSLLEKFDGLGGCVDYVLFDVNMAEVPDVTGESFHPLVALEGMRVIQRRTDE